MCLILVLVTIYFSRFKRKNNQLGLGRFSCLLFFFSFTDLDFLKLHIIHCLSNIKPSVTGLPSGNLPLLIA